jgi:predicted glutamine amidotransferase
MCRLMAISGDFSDVFENLFKSIQDAATYDKYLKELYGDEISPNHPDGWGFVNFNGELINFEKYRDPIYEASPPSIKNGSLMIHARKASKGQPLGALNAHPFHRSLKNSEIFMVHNGGVKKELLKVKDIEVETHTDTETFLFSIRDKGEIVQSLKDALKMVDHKELMSGALNLAIMDIDRKGISRMFAYSDYSKESEYIKLYYVESKKWKGIFSSTITESVNFPDYDSRQILKRKQLYELSPSGLNEI